MAQNKTFHVLQLTNLFPKAARFTIYFHFYKRGAHFLPKISVKKASFKDPKSDCSIINKMQLDSCRELRNCRILGQSRNSSLEPSEPKERNP